MREERCRQANRDTVWINPPVKKPTREDATGTTIVPSDDLRVDRICAAIVTGRHDDRPRCGSHSIGPGVSMSVTGSDEGVSKRPLKIIDWLLVGFVGALLLAVMYLVLHRDASLRSALDVAALVASVALAAALLAALRLPSQFRGRPFDKRCLASRARSHRVSPQ